MTGEVCWKEPKQMIDGILRAPCVRSILSAVSVGAVRACGKTALPLWEQRGLLFRSHTCFAKASIIPQRHGGRSSPGEHPPATVSKQPAAGVLMRDLAATKEVHCIRERRSQNVMTCFLFVLDSSPCASYMEFISFFFLGNVKQILAAIEHCGCNFWFLAASLAPSSNVQRGTPSFVLCCPYNYRSSPISFCPKACSKFTRDSELKHQELEARSEYVVCNPVIKELSNFFFTDFQRLVLSLGTSWSWTWKAWVAGGSGPLGNWW